MSLAVLDMAPWRQRLHGSRLLIVLELTLVAAVLVANHRMYLGTEPYLLVLALSSLAVRGVRWGDLGFRFGPRWPVLLLAGVIAGVSIETVQLLAAHSGLLDLTLISPALSDFRGLVGNPKLLLIWIAGAWLMGGIGLELVWRGYLMNRVADLVGRSAADWAGTLILVSAAFGLAHADLGASAIVENSIDGMLLGLLYLASGRNLIAPIVAHGVMDTINYLVIYSGHYPGM